VTAPYIPADWLLGNGQSFTITGSAVAGRNGPWACPAQVAHEARLKAGSVRPNTTSRWVKRRDNSEQLFFALRDGLDALMRGKSPATAAAINQNLTVAQRRFVTHAMHELLELPGLVADSAGVSLGYQMEAATSSARAGGRSSSRDRSSPTMTTPSVRPSDWRTRRCAIPSQSTPRTSPPSPPWS